MERKPKEGQKYRVKRKCIAHESTRKMRKQRDEEIIKEGTLEYTEKLRKNCKVEVKLSETENLKKNTR